MPTQVETVVALARTQVGYHEKETTYDIYSFDGNNGDKNYNKYAYEFDNIYTEFYNTPKNGFDWCAVFFDWLLVSSFGVDEACRMLYAPKNNLCASCTYSMQYYRAANAYGSEPRVGAQIFFGTRSNQNESTHTGIVVGYDSNYVYTIEGNASDQVYQKQYALDSTRIVGYGYPAYSESITPAPDPPSEEMSEALIHQIALEVIQGKWGNNPERRQRLIAAGYDPDAVQAEVNRILFGEDDETSSETDDVLTIEIDPQKYKSLIIVFDRSGI